MKLEFRKLRADEIECRPARITDKGETLLLYKDARVDQRILDETVGPLRWQRSHQVIDGNLYCTVSIKAEDGEWVSKQDVGTESNTEKEKGQASDSFKRACFNWGIGRELYSAPFIFIQGDPDKLRMEKFRVASIAYDENGNICQLTIVDKKWVVAFKYGEETTEAVKTISKAEVETLKALCEKKGLNPDEVFNVPMDMLTPAQYAEAVRRLR